MRRRGQRRVAKLEQAQEKARQRATSATLVVADALGLEGLGRTFDVAIDCGLFHTFSDAERVRFERSLHRTLRAVGRYVLLYFSEHQPGELGPRRVTQAEIRATSRPAGRWTRSSRDGSPPNCPETERTPGWPR